MNKLDRVLFICILFMFYLSVSAFALHPLITDDTGTQGKGKIQLEMNYQYSHDIHSETSRDPKELVESEIAGQSAFGKVYVKEAANRAGIGLSYGIIDPLDIIIAVPYERAHARERHLLFTGPLQGFSLRESETTIGLSDITAEFKWKFYEFKALNLALKPGFILPTGDESKGMGAGRFGAYGYFITTLDLTPVVLHVNLGYLRNQNSINERENIWHASIAFEFWLVRDYFRLVANAGFERNRDKRSNIQDAFLLAGLVGSPTADCDLDIGFKYSIQSRNWESPGPDYSMMAGATVRFGPNSGDKGSDEKDKNEKKGGK
jgi:hypothetical protein